MPHVSYSERIPSECVSLYTVVSLPDASGSFPVIITRSPYVDKERDVPDEELCAEILARNEKWLDNGYAVVFQHCRGRGKSEGDCIPYVHEREDGLALMEWVRRQPFYCGELYLVGGSYTSSVHYVTAPWESDVKGAILDVQDSERYNCNYRNGFYKSGLHGEWFFRMYKHNSMPRKSFTRDSYLTLPLSELSRIATGERIESFDEILRHPERDDPFWSTRLGGGEAHGAIKHAGIPILLTTGFFDIYTGGVFDAWRELDETTRGLSALVVHPYDHGGTPKNQPVTFDGGELREAFPDLKLRFLDAIRGKCNFPLPRGLVTYYELFGRGYRTDTFDAPTESVTLPLGEGEYTYRYNPYAPASFRGGLSANFGGTAYQDPPNSRYDILSLYTEAFEEDTVLRGKMTARLTVRSTAEDTCFYIRTSLVTEEGDYGLRDDITKLSNVAPDYVPGETAVLDFSFDEIALLVRKGQKLRIDVSSSACPHYVRHTNRRGPFSEQTTAVPADNTVVLSESSITLPLDCPPSERTFQ